MLTELSQYTCFSFVLVFLIVILLDKLVEVLVVLWVRLQLLEARDELLCKTGKPDTSISLHTEVHNQKKCF